MEYTRLLKVSMRGDDVKYMKDILVKLGYLHKSTHDTFGNDTYRAVIEFQKSHTDAADKPLEVDGVIGPLTWDSIIRESSHNHQSEPDVSIVMPVNISDDAAAAIAFALKDVNAIRKKVVLEALHHAWDPAKLLKYPLSLYIRGGNLYNTDLKPNYITADRINSGARRQPQYYTEPAKSIMLEAVEANPKTTGADCSGGIVGLMRYARVVKSSFDATANNLCSGSHSTAIEKCQLLPGDWVGKSGHIGMYVGGGYVVEWAGHKYGCQLNSLSRRTIYDFTRKKTVRLSGWTKYRKPKYY